VIADDVNATSPEHLQLKAADLRRVAARWRAELASLRMTKCSQGRRKAIDSAISLARELEREAEQQVNLSWPQQVDVPLPQRVVELRRRGMTFTAVARTLGIPIGSAKTFARAVRLQGVA
jgi:hypothetical protein